MITLTDTAPAGTGREPVEVDESSIVSIEEDPTATFADRRVVTLSDGQWFLVLESIDEINALIQAAKG